jgi:hypothetical protein
MFNLSANKLAAGLERKTCASPKLSLVPHLLFAEDAGD